MLQHTCIAQVCRSTLALCNMKQHTVLQSDCMINALFIIIVTSAIVSSMARCMQ